MAYTNVLLLALVAIASATTNTFGALNSIGSGYDIVKGKTKLPVIQFTYNEGQQWYNPFSNKVEDNPDQIVVGVYSASSVASAVYYSVQAFAAAAGGAAVVNNNELWNEVAYSQAAAVVQIGTGFVEQDAVVFVTEANYTFYEAMTLPTSMLQASKSLQTLIANLPSTSPSTSASSQAAYQSIIDYYGTHFVVEAEFGARAAAYVVVADTAAAVAYAQEYVQVSQFMFTNMTGSGSATVNVVQENATIVAGGSVNTAAAFVGGLYETFNNYTQWTSTIGKAPAMVNFELKEISELVADPVKKANMQSALKSYAATALKTKQARAAAARKAA